MSNKLWLLLLSTGLGYGLINNTVSADNVVTNSTKSVNYKFKVSTTNANAAMYTLGTKPTQKISYKAIHYAKNYPSTVFWAKEELKVKKSSGTQVYFHIFRLSDGKDFGYIYSGYLGAQKVVNKKTVATKPVFARKVGNQGLLYKQNGSDAYAILTSNGKLANYNDYSFDSYPGTISNGSAWQATTKTLTSEGGYISQFANYSKMNSAEKRSYFFVKNVGSGKTGWINTANLTTNTMAGTMQNVTGNDANKIYQRVSSSDSSANSFYDSFMGNLTTGFFFTGKHKFVNYAPSNTSNNFLVSKTAVVKEADGVKRSYSYVNQLKADGSIGYSGWTRTSNIKLAAANNWMTDIVDVRYTQKLPDNFNHMNANVRQGLIARTNGTATGKSMYAMNGYNYATKPNKYAFALGNATLLSDEETYYVLASATVYKSGVATPYYYVGTAGTTTDGEAKYGWVYKGYLEVGKENSYDQEVYVGKHPVVTEHGFSEWNSDGSAVNAFKGYKHQGMTGDSSAYMINNDLPILKLTGEKISTSAQPERDSFPTPYKPNFMTALEADSTTGTMSGDISTMMYLPYGGYPVSVQGQFSSLATPQSMTFDQDGNLFIAFNWTSEKEGVDSDNRGSIMRISKKLLDGIKNNQYPDSHNLLNRLSNNTPGARWPLFTGDVQIINISNLGHGGSLSTDGNDLYYVERFEDGTPLPLNLPQNEEGEKIDAPAEMGRFVKVTNDLSSVENVQDFYYLNTSSGSFYNVPGNLAISESEDLTFYQVSPNGSGGYFALQGNYSTQNGLIVFRDDVQIENGIGQTAQGVSYNNLTGRLDIIENGGWQSIPTSILDGTDYSAEAANQMTYARLGALAGSGGSTEYLAGDSKLVNAEFESVAISPQDSVNQYYLKVGYNEVMIGNIE